MYADQTWTAAAGFDEGHVRPTRRQEAMGLAGLRGQWAEEGEEDEQYGITG